MDALVTPLGKVKTGEGCRTYLMKKLAEVWLGGPIASLNTFDMEQGNLLEEYARPAFTLDTGMEVEQVGFITTDDEKCGCSPDGIIVGQKVGLEIKCPKVETHLGYLIEGEVPKDYIIQVQASLWVSGYAKWYFYSFCRRMPPLILEVLPDPEIQEAIGEAVEGFLERFDEAMATLTKLNGGVRPETRQKFQMPPEKPKFESDPNDVPH